MITHPEKVLFPDDGITKGELAAYYDDVAPFMLPHLRRRPITMERFPAGLGAKGFLQKDVVKGFPPWLARVEAPKKGGVVHYVMAGDRRSLAWIVNQNTIAIHVWASRSGGWRSGYDDPGSHDPSNSGSHGSFAYSRAGDNRDLPIDNASGVSARRRAVHSRFLSHVPDDFWSCMDRRVLAVRSLLWPDAAHRACGDGRKV